MDDPLPQTRTNGRPWCCPRGHVLGQVVRVHGVRRLRLFREAVYPGYEGDACVIGVASGTIDDIECSLCGRVRNWNIGEEGLRELLEMTGRKMPPEG